MRRPARAEEVAEGFVRGGGNGMGMFACHGFLLEIIGRGGVDWDRGGLSPAGALLSLTA